ncbi:MAG: Fic family protein [Candidatus Alectryocaccobium sp.]|jgi:fido (protein-threonine AMPylation protein)
MAFRWVLDGATVMYGSASELRATPEYDFLQDKDFSYKGLSMDEMIHHLAISISRLWQSHIFSEGNTRTTAEFFIKYLRIQKWILKTCFPPFCLTVQARKLYSTFEGYAFSL